MSKLDSPPVRADPDARAQSGAHGAGTRPSMDRKQLLSRQVDGPELALHEA